MTEAGWSEVERVPGDRFAAALLAELGEVGGVRCWMSPSGGWALGAPAERWPESRLTLDSEVDAGTVRLLVIGSSEPAVPEAALRDLVARAIEPGGTLLVVAPRAGADLAGLDARRYEVGVVGRWRGRDAAAQPVYRLTARAAAAVRPLDRRRPEHPDTLGGRSDWFDKRHGGPQGRDEGRGDRGGGDDGESG